MSEAEPQQQHTPSPAHRLRRMSGRDPHERHRVTTPLELLFDLTFVVAFGIAASQLAHMLAEDHVAAGLKAFAFATFAICWAWINFSWFASAYDTDDWAYRILTMLQMVGVVILGLGLPPMYRSMEEASHLDIGVMVAGYVIMRIALVAQWLRAAKQDPPRRQACVAYASAVTFAQFGWVALAVLQLSTDIALVFAAGLIALELLGPVMAENQRGGTPWHAHHIAERYSLLAIIALGEGVVGTVATLTAVVAKQGWTVDAVLVAVAGTGLTFGMWWTYYIVPMPHLLHAHRDRSFTFGYLHIVVFGSIVGTGAGLHTAAYYIEHHSKLGSMGTVLSVAIPVAAFIASIYLLYMLLVRAFDVLHALLIAGTAVVLVGAVVAAAAGVPMTACLLIVTLAPVVTVVGFELVGHRHIAEVLARTTAEADTAG